MSDFGSVAPAEMGPCINSLRFGYSTRGRELLGTTTDVSNLYLDGHR